MVEPPQELQLSQSQCSINSTQAHSTQGGGHACHATERNYSQLAAETNKYGRCFVQSNVTEVACGAEVQSTKCSQHGLVMRDGFQRSEQHRNTTGPGHLTTPD